MCVAFSLSVQMFSGVERRTVCIDSERYREKPSMDKHKIILINSSVTLIIMTLLPCIRRGELLLECLPLGKVI